MKKNRMAWNGSRWMAAAALTALIAAPAIARDDEEDRPGDRLEGRAGHEQSQIRRGFEINPVPLNLAGKSVGMVGLGSYLVNTTGCNDCHTNPSYLLGHDPFLGEPERINAAGFLAGGRHFGPVIVSANITPDKHGKPAGLTRDEFIQTLRTGHNPHDPKGEILQVMPWPVIGKKLDRDLSAIYDYLSAIPSRP